MSKKTKLILMISSFCFVLATCLFSVFAVKTFNFNMAGTIDFIAPGVEATVSAATLDGISKKSGSGTMSTFTTTRGMSASDIAALSGVQSWTGIALLFDDDSEGQATISFTIKNNSSKDTENIMVSLSSNTTTSSAIQATPSADFCIVPGGSHEFTISLKVANPDVSVTLSGFFLTVELKAIKTSEIPSMSEQEDSGLIFTPSESGNTAILTSYTGSATSVEIPSIIKDASGNIYTVAEIPDAETEEESPFYEVRDTITSISLPSTLTKIGDNAFYGCGSLTGDLIIPDSVETIGNYAFNGCGSLTGDLIIPDSVTTIGQKAFSDCAGFGGDLIIGNSVTSIGKNAFDSCEGFMGELTIGNSVITIEDNAFMSCNQLSGDLIIPNSVQTIGKGAFNSCFGLNGTLSIGSGVKEIGSTAFPSGFLWIVVDEKNENYYSSGNCLISKQDNVLIKGCNNSVIPQDEGISKIDHSAFYGCEELAGDLIIPNSVTQIEDFAFKDCSKLTSITILATTPPTLGGTSCFDYTGTGSIYVPKESVDAYKTATNWSEYADRITAIV